MHLAILTRQRPVGVDHYGRVVINTRCASFEKRGDNYNFALARKVTERIRARPGNGFSQSKILLIFALAKVARAKQLLETDDLCTFFRSRFDALDSLSQISCRIFAAAHLNKPDSRLFRPFRTRHSGHQSSEFELKKQKRERKSSVLFLSLEQFSVPAILDVAQRTPWSFPRRLSRRLHCSRRDHRS